MVQYDLMGRNQGPTRHHLRSSPRQGSSSPYSKRNTPSCEPFHTTSLHHPCPSQPGKCYSSAVGSYWVDQPRTPRMPTATASWKHDWTHSGLKIGLLYGPWYVPNATFPPPPKHVRGQRLNKRKLEFAKLLRLPGRAKKAERWQQHEMRRQYLSPGRSLRRSRASTQLILTQPSHLLLESQSPSQLRSWTSSRSPSNECHVLGNRDPWACALSTGTTLVLRPETVIHLPGSLPTSPRPPSQRQCYNTHVQAKSHHSLNLREDTDHSL